MLKQIMQWLRKNHIQPQNAVKVVMTLIPISMSFTTDEQYSKQNTRLCNKQLS